MNRIDRTFEKLRACKQCAFIPFITAGDPSIEVTRDLILELDRAGSSVIEIGIPFSDPVADGETIQRANRRALEKGIHLKQVFEMVGDRREEVEAPLVFLIYANMIYHYGIEHFFRSCKANGVDGIVVPDMPMEELSEYEAIAKQHDVHMIRLIAPTSKERIQQIARDAKGFIYCVSSMGVTGVRAELGANLEGLTEMIREVTELPICIGFGIATKEQAKALSRYADGVIIGSAIVRQVEEYGEHSPRFIRQFAEEILVSIKK